MDGGVYTKVLEAYNANDCDAVITALKVPDPSKFGILKASEEGYLESIIEKPPDDRYGNLANAGVYIFPKEIFPCIQETQKSVRGEYELTDSLQMLIDKGYRVKIVDISEFYWNDVGHPWQLLDTNRYILSKLPTDENVINLGGVIEDFVHIQGPVVIGKDAIIRSGSYIEGPAYIGEKTVIGPQAYIRPYSSIGNECHIGNSSEVKASVIMDHVFAAHLSYIGDSIIGEGVNFGCGAITANVRLDKKPISMEIKGNKVPTGLSKMGAVLGDWVSLGIQVSIMPGKTIGSYSHIGSNTIIQENIPPHSLVYVKQEQIIKNLESAE
jgi:bifunctional UDP-N-acetylglucosamine pyrophosphorylase/glucosamine-1-phosphate N-acetyltransferase